MPEMRVPKSEIKKQTEKIKPATKVKITGTAATTPRVSNSMTLTTSGISGSGGRSVAPIYKPLQGGMMGPAKIQGPQLPKKNKPSVVSKIKKAIKDELFRETHDTL